MPTFEISDLGKFESWLTNELKASVQRGMYSGAFRGVQIIITKIIPRAMPYPPVDKGIYRAAWRVEGNGREGPIEIVNNAPHAPFIEYGVRAENIKIGRKMIQALTEWSKRHGASSGDKAEPVATPSSSKPEAGPKPEKNEFIKQFEKLVKNLASFIKRLRIGADTKKTGEKKTVEPMSDVAATRMAWAIAMSMKKKGIFKGTGLRIAEQAQKDIVSILEVEIAREITRNFK